MPPLTSRPGEPEEGGGTYTDKKGQNLTIYGRLQLGVRVTHDS